MGALGLYLALCSGLIPGRTISGAGYHTNPGQVPARQVSDMLYYYFGLYKSPFGNLIACLFLFVYF